MILETTRIKKKFTSNQEETKNFIHGLDKQIHNADQIEDLANEIACLTLQFNGLQESLLGAAKHNENRFWGFFGTKRKLVTLIGAWGVTLTTLVLSTITAGLDFTANEDDKEDRIALLIFIILTAISGGVSFVITVISECISRKDKTLSNMAEEYIEKIDSQEREEITKFFNKWKQLRVADKTSKAQKRFSACMKELDSLPEKVADEKVPDQEELLSALLTSLPKSHPCYDLIQKIIRRSYPTPVLDRQRIPNLPQSPEGVTFEGEECFSSSSEGEEINPWADLERLVGRTVPFLRVKDRKIDRLEELETDSDS